MEVIKELIEIGTYGMKLGKTYMLDEDKTPEDKELRAELEADLKHQSDEIYARIQKMSVEDLLDLQGYLLTSIQTSSREVYEAGKIYGQEGANLVAGKISAYAGFSRSIVEMIKSKFNTNNHKIQEQSIDIQEPVIMERGTVEEDFAKPVYTETQETANFLK